MCNQGSTPSTLCLAQQVEEGEVGILQASLSQTGRECLGILLQCVYSEFVLFIFAVSTDIFLSLFWESSSQGLFAWRDDG